VGKTLERSADRFLDRETVVFKGERLMGLATADDSPSAT
jgi:hypothetical protein